MSTKLCTKCGQTRSKPWDRNCKAVNLPAENLEGAVGGDVLPKNIDIGKENNGDKHSEALNTLISSVRDISRHISTYDKKFEELAEKINAKVSVPPTRTYAMATPPPDTAEPTLVDNVKETENQVIRGARPKHKRDGNGTCLPANRWAT